jgi:hypothetical protein
MVSTRNLTLGLLIAVIALGVVYMLDPSFFGLLGRRGAEGFYGEVVESTGAGSMTGDKRKEREDAAAQAAATAAGGMGDASSNAPAGTEAAATSAPAAPAMTAPAMSGGAHATEGFENLSPADAQFPDARRPGNCYPKNQLAPQELLPGDPNSKWAQVNPVASGDIAGKNFLSAGALIGVNTVGQSNRNANWDIRAAPPNPQMVVSPWMQTTISPDLERRPLDIA